MNTKHRDAIANAADLDDLLAALQTAESHLAVQRHDDPHLDFGEGIEQEFGVDLASLPTFGGPIPDDTIGVFSWDADRVLVADGSAWAIEPRYNDA